MYRYKYMYIYISDLMSCHSLTFHIKIRHHHGGFLPFGQPWWIPWISPAPFHWARWGELISDRPFFATPSDRKEPSMI